MYRQTHRGEAPTTVEAPFADVTIGVVNAVTEVQELAGRRLIGDDGRIIHPATDREPLPGGETADLEVLIEAARARGAPEPTARQLVASYGSEAAAVLNLVERERSLGEPIVPGRPEIWAEVTYAVEREMAVRLQDVMIRRLHFYYETRDQGQSVAGMVASRMKKLLGWDDAREAEERSDYRRVVEQSQAFRRTSKA